MGLRIPVMFDPQRAPFVAATVHWRKRRTSALLAFLLDTGAYDLTLSADDARRLDAPLEDLPVSRLPTFGIGGEVQSYDMPEVSIAFTCSSGKRMEFRMKTVRVIGYPKGGSSCVGAGVPSLLGRRFLRKAGFVLHYDFGHDSAFLEMKGASSR
jgi:hypothetical protein